jgi:hypothetical protein
MRAFLKLLILFLTISACGLAAPPFGEPLVMRSGDWEYRVFYKDKGRKSEGLDGHLSFQGKPVPVSVVPEYIETPFGEMTFFPSPKTLDRPGIAMGWTLRDYDKIPWTIVPRPSDLWEQRDDWRKKSEPPEAPKLVMNLVSIPETKTYIFVVGSIGFNSVASLKMFLGAQPAGTVVEWNPGCLRGGGELLFAFEKELSEFKSYLEKRKIKFVQIPSG